MFAQALIGLLAFAVTLTTSVNSNAQDLKKPETSSIGRLNMVQSDRRAHCTTILVGPRAAITAKHCIDLWTAFEMHVLLGYERGKWKEHLRVNQVHRVSDQDIAVLCLTGKSDLMPYPLASAAEVSGRQKSLVLGYARSRQHLISAKECRYRATGNRALLSCPLEPGFSGAPVLIDVDGTAHLAGIISRTSKTQSLVELTGNLPKVCAP